MEASRNRGLAHLSPSDALALCNREWPRCTTEMWGEVCKSGHERGNVASVSALSLLLLLYEETKKSACILFSSISRWSQCEPSLLVEPALSLSPQGTHALCGPQVLPAAALTSPLVGRLGGIYLGPRERSVVPSLQAFPGRMDFHCYFWGSPGIC